MNVNFTVELFDKTINSNIDISDCDLENLSKDDKHYFILECISNEINNNIQICIDELVDE